MIITGFSIGFFVYGLLFITAQYNYVIVPQIKTARAESLSASCSVTTTSADTAVWTAVSSGGTGSVTYSWSGTDGLTDSTSITTKTYTTSGIKTGTITVVSGGSSSSATCSIVITISTPPPTPPPAPPQCSDSIDNDGDGLIDFPSDPGCSDSSDTDETDAPTPPPPTPPPTPPTPPSPTPAPPSSGGGGGGGTPIRLEINNEKVERVSTSTALVTFETNLQANGQVLYDTTSYASSTLPFAEYVSSTIKTNLLLTKHSVKISGLNPNTTYYFRPLAFRSTEEKGGIELVLKLVDEVEKPEESIVVSKVCSKYILEPIKFGEDNSIIEVLKLQTFLNDYEGFNLDITGVYNLPTYEAVKTFQKRYVQDILTPWGIEESTGYVYITTMKKINDIYCEKFISFSLEDVSEEERVEIEEFNALFESLRIEGILNIDTSSVGLIDSNEEDSNIDRELASGPVFEDTDRIIEILSDPDTVSVINTLKKDEGVGKKIKNFFNNINITDFLGALFYFTF